MNRTTAPTSLLLLHATHNSNDTNNNKTPVILTQLAARAKALLSQCLVVSLMLLAQFRPVSPLASSSLPSPVAPQGMYYLCVHVDLC